MSESSNLAGSDKEEFFTLILTSDQGFLSLNRTRKIAHCSSSIAW